VSNPRDELDAWLDADVQPLAPPPGTYERVTRKARRRKVSRALVSAAGAVVIVAGLAASPKIASLLTQHPAGRGQQSLATGRTSAPVTPPATPTATPGGGTPAAKSATPEPTAGSSLSAAPSGASVPGDFRPTSVTFVGPQIGAVIGQAGTPGHCAGGVNCTSLAGTDDYGRTWYGVSAPATGAPDGPAGVSQVRFLHPDQGFAFGPELWITLDGGASWSRLPLPRDTRVTDLETLNGQVFALWARCMGGGADFAADCTSYTLHTAPVGGQWRQVGGAVDLTAGGAATSASLLLVGDPAAATGYLLAPDGKVLSGSLDSTGWTTAGTAPCVPGAAQPDGQPSGALMAAGSGELYLLCAAGPTSTPASPPASRAPGTLYVSADGGKTWHQRPAVAALGTATSLAAATGNLVVLATSDGIEVSRDDGRSWQVTLPAAAGPPGGFRYVGMTEASQGVAVPENPALQQIWLTTDGGQSWQPSTVQGTGGG
jgi:photosystem II stability/assembly factor-like uncharacterized protein